MNLYVNSYLNLYMAVIFIQFPLFSPYFLNKFAGIRRFRIFLLFLYKNSSSLLDLIVPWGPLSLFLLMRSGWGSRERNKQAMHGQLNFVGM